MYWILFEVKKLKKVDRSLRAIIFTVFVFYSFADSIYAQGPEKIPFVLSQRVGIEIDSNEVEYFNIFPDLSGVKSVVYRKDNFENLRMLVSLSKGTDTTITFSKLATEELKKYIDKHEILADSQKIVNWELLPGYGISRLNYFEDHGSLLYVYTDSLTLAGKLLMMDDNSLILWSSTQPFRPENWKKFAIRIYASNIRRIVRKQDLTGKIFGITLGAGIGVATVLNIGISEESLDEKTLLLIGGGALVGAGLGWFYDRITFSRRKFKIGKSLNNFQKAKSKLENRTVFRNIFPPELKNL